MKKKRISSEVLKGLYVKVNIDGHKKRGIIDHLSHIENNPEYPPVLFIKGSKINYGAGMYLRIDQIIFI